MRRLQTALPLLLLLLPPATPPAGARPDLPVDEAPVPEYQIKFLDFSPCPDCENVNIIKDVSIRRIGKTAVAIYGTFVIGKAISEDDHWTAKVLIFRQDGDNAQSRMLVAEIPVEDMCEKMKSENYQRLLSYMEGEVSKECPLTTGTFSLVGYEVSFDSMKGKLQPGVWIIQVVEFVGPEPEPEQISCYMVEVEVHL